MADAGKILVTASSRIKAGSRCARPAARAIRSRTAANLSPRFSITVGSPQYNQEGRYGAGHLRTLQAGKQADLVVLEGNPAAGTADITQNRAGFQAWRRL
jgi:hypothetical protein